MQTMTLEAEVSTDGMIHLDLPVNLPPGTVDVQLEIQQKANSGIPTAVHKSLLESRQERFDEILRLLRLGLAGVAWEEIKQGRIDDENRY